MLPCILCPNFQTCQILQKLHNLSKKIDNSIHVIFDTLSHPTQNSLLMNFQNIRDQKPVEFMIELPRILEILEEGYYYRGVAIVDFVMRIVQTYIVRNVEANKKTMDNVYHFIKLNCFRLARCLKLSNGHIHRATQDRPQIRPQIKNIFQMFTNIITSYCLQNKFPQIYTTLKKTYSKIYLQNAKYIRSSVHICLAQFYSLKMSQQNQKEVVQFMLECIKISQSKIVRFNVIYGLINFYLRDGMQEGSRVGLRGRLFGRILDGLQLDDSNTVLQYWMKCFNLILTDNVTPVQVAEIQPYFRKILTTLSTILKKPQTKIHTKQKSFQVLLSLIQIPQILTKQKSEICLHLCFDLLAQESLITNKGYLNQTCEFMMALVKNMDIGLAQGYVDVVFGKLMEMGGKMQFQDMVVLWNKLCSAGVKAKKWQQFYQKLLHKIKSPQTSSTTTTQQQQLQQYQYYTAIEQTTKLYHPEFINHYLFLPTIQTLFKNLKQRIEKWQQKSIYVITNTINTILKNLDQYCCQMMEQGWIKIMGLVMEYLVGNLQEIENNTRSFQVAQKISVTLPLLAKIVLPFQSIQYKHELFMKIMQIDIQLATCKNQHYQTRQLKRNQIRQQINQLNQLNQISEMSDESLMLSQTEIQNPYLDTALNQTQCQSQIFDQRHNNNMSEGYILEDLNRCRININGILKVLLEGYMGDMGEKGYESVLRVLLAKYRYNQGKRNDIWYVKQALSYVSVIVEVMPFGKFQQEYQNFLGFIEKYSRNNSINLRSSVVQTLGILAKNTPLKKINQILLQRWAQIISNCYLTTPNIRQCEELCLLSSGKILIKFCQNFDLKDLFCFWIEKIQIMTDIQEDESIDQIMFFCQLVINSPMIIIDDNSLSSFEMIVRVLKMFCRVNKQGFKLERLPRNQKLVLFVKNAVESISSWNIFESMRNQIVSRFTKEERRQLDLIMKR